MVADFLASAGSQSRMILCRSFRPAMGLKAGIHHAEIIGFEGPGQLSRVDYLVIRWRLASGLILPEIIEQGPDPGQLAAGLKRARDLFKALSIGHDPVGFDLHRLKARRAALVVRRVDGWPVVTRHLPSLAIAEPAVTVPGSYRSLPDDE